MVDYGRFKNLGGPIVGDMYPDWDNDGLSDKDELALGTDMWEPDSDLDQLPDGLEVVFHFTDPLCWDSDGDFLRDGDEFDTDDDGLTDGAEFHDYGTDIFDWDTDDDFLSDGEEIYHGLDPHDPYSADGNHLDYLVVYSDVALFQAGFGSPPPNDDDIVHVRGIDRHDNTWWGGPSPELHWVYTVELECLLAIDKIHLKSSFIGGSGDRLEVWAVIEFPGGQSFVQLFAEQPVGEDFERSFPQVVTNYVEFHAYRDFALWSILTLEIYGQLHS